jgi:predicted nucleic acid-binding protein
MKRERAHAESLGMRLVNIPGTGWTGLYVTDRHSGEAERKLVSRPALWFTPLHVAEWTHAIEQHVFRKLMSRGESDRIIEKFNEHRSRGLCKEGAVSEQALEVCAQLARKFAARLGVRTLDSLHVALALELNAERFWTFDERQGKLPQAVGLRLR